VLLSSGYVASHDQLLCEVVVPASELAWNVETVGNRDSLLELVEAAPVERVTGSPQRDEHACLDALRADLSRGLETGGADGNRLVVLAP